MRYQNRFLGRTFLVMLLVFSLASCASSQKEIVQKQREKLQLQREQYVRTHSELDQEKKNAILKGLVLPGMSLEEVTGCLGDPVGPQSITDTQQRCIGFGSTSRISVCFKDQKATHCCKKIPPKVTGGGGYLVISDDTGKLLCSPLPALVEDYELF
jgi:hypothetical protein